MLFSVAILFKDKELTNTEHRDWNHIKYKAEQFRKHINAEQAAPFLARLVRRQAKELNEATEA